MSRMESDPAYLAGKQKVKDEVERANYEFARETASRRLRAIIELEKKLNDARMVLETVMLAFERNGDTHSLRMCRECLKRTTP